MKKTIYSLLPLSLFILPCAYAQPMPMDNEGAEMPLDAPMQAQPDQSDQTIDEIVAVVDDDIILRSELNQAVAELQQQNPEQAEGTPANVLRSQVLDQLIMRKLQAQRAKQAGIEVTDQEMRQGLQSIAQRNNMNLQEFAQAVQQNGMDMEELRDHIGEEIQISKLRRQEVMSKVSVSDADIDRYLHNQSLRMSGGHEYRLRQIKLEVADDADSTAKGIVQDRLRNLRKQINKGDKSFEEAAQSVSEGEHASDGGDLGWVAGSNLPNGFEAALAGLTQGQMSQVFEGPDGLYLIKLEDERDAGENDESEDEKVMKTEARLRHIVIRPNEIRDADQSRDLAEEIRQRLLDGDDFKTLARKYSDDKATARQGGDVGWTDIEQLPPQIQDQIESMDEDDISQVFESQDGYEIMQLQDKRTQDKTEQAKRDKVRQTLGNQKVNEEGELWLREMRDEAYVDIRMPDYQPTPDEQ